MKLYVNGVLKDVKIVDTAAIKNIPTRDILIGKMGNDKYLRAEFDEFVVYHRALNDSEVGELYGLKCDDFVSEEEVSFRGDHNYTTTFSAALQMPRNSSQSRVDISEAFDQQLCSYEILYG